MNDLKAHTAPPSPAGRRAELIARAALAAACVWAYGTTLYPGVWQGDSAELQYVIVQLGVAHPPGYDLLILVGKLFTLLPFGPDEAWRVNVLTAVCGIVATQLVYAAVRRITGSTLAALTAAGTLAFSALFWTHCILAEVYSFCTMFLALAIYAACRLVESNRVRWLITLAVSLGVCIGERPAELFVLPAFLVLWWINRRRVTLGPRRLAIALLAAAAPPAASVAHFVIASNTPRIWARDRELRDRVVRDRTPFHELTAAAKLRETVAQRLALKWSRSTYVKWSWLGLEESLSRYAWALSGLGAVCDRYPPGDARNEFQGRGTSIGPPGVLLAILGAACWRGTGGWRAFTLLLVCGNFAFYLYHHPPDSLTFTLPGLTGLSMLAGFAVAAGLRWTRPAHRRAAAILGLLTPLLLLATNHRWMSRSPELDRGWMEHCRRIATAPLPPDSAIFLQAGRGWADNFTYLFHVSARRPDIQIMQMLSDYSRAERSRLVQYFVDRGQPVFLRREECEDELAEQLVAATPPALAQLGFLQLSPAP